ncbi:ChuX/HutX family heme-like substrate-binding protein, partial [Pseudoroseomonas deserti]|uniref:ChuX/HutX family heme-like substrate-binding protein n=1 Tax=Teichococcus deserti TaxID=1817963 RepID=UPI003462853B
SGWLEAHGWFNGGDPDFDRRLRGAGVAGSWGVVEPTAGGAVTSMGLLEGRGEAVARLCGARKPGQRELPAWRALAEGLAAAPLAA